jgi:hypothetical protein
MVNPGHTEALSREYRLDSQAIFDAAAALFL